MPRQAEAARLILTTQLRPLALEAPSEILTSEVKAAILRGEITFPIHDPFRFDFMKMVTGLFTPYFARMVWEIVKAEEGCSFVTSDSPVSFANQAVVVYRRAVYADLIGLICEVTVPVPCTAHRDMPATGGALPPIVR